MKHRRYFEFLSGLPLILVLLGGVLFIAAPSYGATLKVGTCDHATYSTIQAAVTAASPGDKIRVCPGLYPENVTIATPSLTLQGAGPDPKKRTSDITKESVIQPGAGIALNLMADDIVIEGFTVNEATGSAGVLTSPAFSGYQIRRNRINVDPDNGVGLNLNSSDDQQTVIEENYFDGNGDMVGAHDTDGIFSNVGLHQALIKGNTFVRAKDGAGIVMLVSGLATISDVIIEHNTSFQDDSFVALFNAPGTIIRHNDVDQSVGSGIFLGSGNDGAVISNNKLSDGFRGIQTSVFFGGPANTGLEISHNDVRNMADSGIYASGIPAASMLSSLVSENSCRNNGADGIRLGPGNSGNTILKNEMKDNLGFDAHDETVGAGTAGTANTWLKNKCNTSFPAGLCK